MTGVMGLVLLLESRQPMGYRETCGERDSNSMAAGYRPSNTPLSHVTAPGISRVLYCSLTGQPGLWTTQPLLLLPPLLA